MDAITAFDKRLELVSPEWRDPLIDVIDTFENVQIGLKSIGIDDSFVLIEAARLVLERHDKIARPVVSGVYFISKENEGTLMRPFPALFNNVSEFQIQYVHPLPDNEVIQVDQAEKKWLKQMLNNHWVQVKCHLLKNQLLI